MGTLTVKQSAVTPSSLIQGLMGTLTELNSPVFTPSALIQGLMGTLTELNSPVFTHRSQ